MYSSRFSKEVSMCGYAHVSEFVEVTLLNTATRTSRHVQGKQGSRKTYLEVTKKAVIYK